MDSRWRPPRGGAAAEPTLILNGRCLQPHDARAHGGDDGWGGVGDAHEIAEQVGGLAGGKGGGLVVAAGDGLEGERVVLLGPDGALPRYDDLGGEDAVERTGCCGGGLAAKICRNEGVVALAGGRVGE